MQTQLFTGYYAGPKRGLEISISRKEPTWYVAKNKLPELAPPEWVFVHKGNPTLYTRLYKEHLQRVSIESVLTKIGDMLIFEQQTEATLLCWEKPGDFCHRHLVAQWFADAGYDIEEVPQVQKKTDNQLSFF